MKVLALLGSPRKGGNTDLLVESFLEGAGSRGAEVDKVYLNDLEIRGCQACLSCHKTGRCRQKDDMIGVHQKLLAADLWVVATPVYWWGPSAQTKSAIDRMYCLCYGDNPEKIKGKRMVVITASADEIEKATPYVLGMMRDSCSFLEMEWAGELTVQAYKKGEVRNQAGALAAARSLGEETASMKK